MNRTVKKLLIFFLIGVLMLALGACSSNANNNVGEDTEIKAVGIAVDTDSVPKDAVAGAVDVAKIKFTVFYSDKTSEVMNIDANGDMISVADRSKLNTAGSYTIKVVYAGCTGSFQITLSEREKRSYMLNVYNGVPAVVNNVTVNETIPDGSEFFSKAYEEGTVIVLKPIIPANNSFDYWQDFSTKIDNQQSTVVTMNQAHTYTAFFKSIVSTVTFVTNGADQGSISPKSVNTLNSTDIVKLTKLNDQSGMQYVFDGWTTDSAAVGDDAVSFAGKRITFPYVVSLETTLYATWRPLGLVYTEYGDRTGYIVNGYSLNYIGADTPISEYPTSLEIPTTYKGADVVGIAIDAFTSKEASLLRSITIPDTVEFIDEGAFRNCKQLTEIAVNSASHSFASVDGVLYNYAQDKLIAYPANKIAVSFASLTGVKNIASYAYYNALIGKLIMPNGLATVGNNALNSVHIDQIDFSAVNPANVTFANNLFSANINSIYVDSAFLNSYPSIDGFRPFIERLTSNSGELATVGISADGKYLYRTILNENSVSPSTTAEIIGALRSISGSVIIPVKMNKGYDISSIGLNAFADCVFLTGVSFPTDSKLERIADDAFLNTPWLTALLTDKTANKSIVFNNVLYKYLGNADEYRLAKNITKIAESAFRNNITLKKLELGDNTDLNFIGAYAFYGCDNLSGAMIFKPQLAMIYHYAFANTALTSISLQSDSKLTKIGEGAFSGCHYLKNFTLGVRTANVAANAFLDCFSLESFSVPNESMHFKAFDGVLYYCSNGDGEADVLFNYPSGRLCSVFDVNNPKENLNLNVVQIGDYAFYYSNIAALKIPAGVKSIQPNSIAIPGLIYVEFVNITTNFTYTSIFTNANSGIENFEPEYVVLDNLANKDAFYAGNTIAKNNKHKDAVVTVLDYVDSGDVHTMVYGYTDDADKTIFIAKTNRTAEYLAIADDVNLSLTNTQISIIKPYAVFGYYLKELSLGSNITQMDNYALYGAEVLAKLTVNTGISIPSVEANTFGKTFDNGMLVYVQSEAINNYITAWKASGNKYFIPIETKEAVATFSYKTGEESSVHINPISKVITANNVPTPKRIGYVFLGWMDDSGEIIDFTKDYYIPYNITLIASWQPVTYTINFVVENDVVMEHRSVTVKFGDKFVFDTPTTPNRVFAYWRDATGKTYGKDSSDETYNTWQTYLEGEGITLYAVWNDKEYKIIYDTETLEKYNTTVDTTEVKVKYGDNYTLAVPTLDGFVFMGWSIEPIVDGVVPTLITDNLGKNLILWSYNEKTSYMVYPYIIARKNIKVELYLDENTKYGEYTDIVYGESFAFAYDPSTVADEKWKNKTEYCFVGWVDEYGSKVTDYNGDGLFTWNKSANTKLFAKWATKVGQANIALLSEMSDFSESFVLTSDITLTKPIGNKNSPYTGVFNGNGHIINFNYTVNAESSDFDGYVGVFAYNKGTLINLQIVADIDIQSNVNYEQELYLGAVAGRNDGKIISNYAAESAEYSGVKDVVASIKVNVVNRNVHACVGAVVGQNYGVISSISSDIKSLTFAINGNTYKKITSVSDEIYLGLIVGYVNSGSVTSQRINTYALTGEDDYFKDNGSEFGYLSDNAVGRIENLVKS